MVGRLGIDCADGLVVSRGLPGRRAELVFAYLTVEHHRTVSRDELADALWPDMLPDTWAAALRSVVTEVRRFLEEAGLDAGEAVEDLSDPRRQRGGHAAKTQSRPTADGGRPSAAAISAFTCRGIGVTPPYDQKPWI